MPSPVEKSCIAHYNYICLLCTWTACINRIEQHVFTVLNSMYLPYWTACIYRIEQHVFTVLNSMYLPYFSEQHVFTVFLWTACIYRIFPFFSDKQQELGWKVEKETIVWVNILYSLSPGKYPTITNKQGTKMAWGVVLIFSCFVYHFLLVLLSTFLLSCEGLLSLVTNHFS